MDGIAPRRQQPDRGPTVADRGQPELLLEKPPTALELAYGNGDGFDGTDIRSTGEASYPWDDVT
jgi:hypothetical protein